MIGKILLQKEDQKLLSVLWINQKMDKDTHARFFYFLMMPNIALYIYTPALFVMENMILGRWIYINIIIFIFLMKVTIQETLFQMFGWSCLMATIFKGKMKLLKMLINILQNVVSLNWIKWSITKNNKPQINLKMFNPKFKQDSYELKASFGPKSSTRLMKKFIN